MEHYRSTLATAALAVFGLVAAAHILHPANFERSDPRRRVVTMTAEGPPPSVTWGDPSIELRGPEPGQLMADSRMLLAHHTMVAMPADERTVPRLSGVMVAPATPVSASAKDPIGALIRELNLDRRG